MKIIKKYSAEEEHEIPDDEIYLSTAESDAYVGEGRSIIKYRAVYHYFLAKKP